MIDAQHVATLETGKWFQALPATLKSKLLSIAALKRFQNTEALFCRGDRADGLYAVLSGSFRITGLNSEGKEAVLTFIEAPNWIGEVALFDRDARTHDAIAFGESIVLHCPQAELDSLLSEAPVYWREFGLLVSHKLRLTFKAIEDLALLPAPLRLARRLILMAEGYGEVNGAAKSHLSVPQEQLGAMLAISRQTTNQILKSLSDRALIRVRYGEIEILDLDGLRQFCEASQYK